MTSTLHLPGTEYTMLEKDFNLLDLIESHGTLA